ncbi:MAG: MCE family protein [Lentisphaeria bacterium]|nr:MCE family protein [Lentisphaeria bacterium]
MDERKNQLRTGIFVTLSLVLLVLMLFYFGLSEMFVRRAKAVTCFAESVQGLSVGSEVKFCGVRVGEVTDISILSREKLIKVDMAIELKHFKGVDESGDADVRDMSFRDFMEKEMKEGLRCRLEFQGITGMKYVSLDYFSKSGDIPVAPVEVREEGAFYIPAVSSTFKDILVALTNAVDRLSKMKFETLFGEVESVLKELNSRLADPALGSSLKNISRLTATLEKSAGNVSRVFSEERMEKLVSVFEQNLVNYNRLAKQLEKISQDMKLPESASGFRDMTAAAIEIRQELTVTLQKLGETLESIRRLAEQINRDPGFIFGGARKSQRTEE